MYNVRPGQDIYLVQVHPLKVFLAGRIILQFGIRGLQYESKIQSEKKQCDNDIHEINTR